MPRIVDDRIDRIPIRMIRRSPTVLMTAMSLGRVAMIFIRHPLPRDSHVTEVGRCSTSLMFE
jgi:hypothetical protein